MTLREWFRIDKRDAGLKYRLSEEPTIEEQVQEIEARIPGQPIFQLGVLDPRSQTWIFINAWAHEALQKAREKNDSMNRDIAQTSMLRGEIRLLKELINLPNPKPGKGLLEEED